MNFNEFKQKSLQNDAIKAEYEQLQPQYALIRQLIALRQSQQLTQQQLAEKTGIAQSAISRLEAGTQPLHCIFATHCTRLGKTAGGGISLAL